METTQPKLLSNPCESASILSKLTFFWTLPLFKKGYSKILELCDLYETLHEDRAAILGERLNRVWLNQLNETKRPSLLKAILKTFWKECFLLAMICFVYDVVLRTIQPILLRGFLLYFKKNSDVSHANAVLYATGLVIINAATILFSGQVFLISSQIGMKIRVAVCSIIYKKVLRLSQTALGDTQPGQIVNLISNDVSRFDLVGKFLNAMWTAPLLVCIITYLLWREIEWPGMIGIGIVFIIVPIQSYIGRLATKYRRQTAHRTDKRVQFMDEIISGIQVIKMYAWEWPFTQLITLSRRSELQVIRKNSYVRAIFLTFMLFTTRMALFCTMLSLILLYGEENITAAKVFVISVYFNSIAYVSHIFVRGLVENFECLVAIKRLQHFLLSEEKKTAQKENINLNGTSDEKRILLESEELPTDNSIAISIKNASARWMQLTQEEDDRLCPDSMLRSPTLDDINANFPKGKLIGIIGPVGEGKSSFLQVLLRELPLDSGTITIYGSVSYCSQESWVFGGSIRQNILFGQDMDRDRFEEIIKACALEKDFRQLPQGERTIISENGASLSGGQKARINLARALYRRADVYLLDDPLSAVDAHVGRHLFDECIGPYGMLARQNATRILVTHQVHLLKDADWLVVLKNGKIEVQGSPGDLYRSGVDFVAYINAGTETHPDEDNANYWKGKRSRNSSRVCLRSVSTISAWSIYSDYDEQGTKDNDHGSEETLNNFEMSSKGKVKGSLLLQYFKAGSHFGELIIILILFGLAQLIASGCDYWVSFWISQEEKRVASVINETIYLPYNYDDLVSTDTCIYIYCAFLVGIFVTATVRSIGFFNVCVRSSQNLHDWMFTSIISTTIRFFNINPSGRILNRFSKDLGTVDELLPRALLDAVHTNLYMLGAVVLTIIVNPLFIIPISVIGLLFFYMRGIYLKTSKNIKRIESIARSPVFTHLSLSLDGLPTIRASHVEDSLMREFDAHQDTHSASWYIFIATSAAFGLALDFLCWIFVFLVIFSFLLLDTGVSGDKVGLAITEAMTMTGLLQWGIRHSVDVTNQMVSVERILEYRNLEKEKQPDQPRQLSNSWPAKGKIEFRNVIFKYFEEADPVLREISFIVQPNEKVGIVGRTGAGKSSLIGTIFRLGCIKGEILIDGIDTSIISLKDLRSRVAIIPQNPVLFSGTLRLNLDPFNEYDDDTIWKSLKEVELKDNAGDAIPLDMTVQSNGNNFSVGQRQLICLSRAILRKNKILILDEATANVDPQTDSFIQQTIRAKFADCTVLTVAHRLNTIIDSDRVLVMKAGKAVEFDTPYSLLQKPNGVFKDMVLSLGFQEADRLVKIAEDTYNAKVKQNAE